MKTQSIKRILALSYAICITPNICGFVSFRPYTKSGPSLATTTFLPMATSSAQRPEVDDEIERLRAQAAKLRAEAAALEAAKLQQMVGLQELKDGLERLLKTELSESRAKELMDAFDASGDGTLQKEEFATINRFWNKLDSLVREEKDLVFVRFMSLSSLFVGIPQTYVRVAIRRRYTGPDFKQLCDGIEYCLLQFHYSCLMKRKVLNSLQDLIKIGDLSF